MIRLLTVAYALLTVVPTEASADISIQLSNQELTSSSEVIVIGRATVQHQTDLTAASRQDGQCSHSPRLVRRIPEASFG